MARVIASLLGLLSSCISHHDDVFLSHCLTEVLQDSHST